MTYQEARQTKEAKNWTIGIGNGYQPKHNGSPVGIAHNTLDAARIYIISQIYHSSDEYKTWYQDQQNKLYRDFDLC